LRRRASTREHRGQPLARDDVAHRPGGTDRLREIARPKRFAISFQSPQTRRIAFDVLEDSGWPKVVGCFPAGQSLGVASVQTGGRQSVAERSSTRNRE
jgi:hypothetical protein